MTGMKLLYMVIALATAWHSAYGAATVMAGPMPTELSQVLVWSLQGAFYAMAIDVGMFVLSGAIRANKQRSTLSIGRFRVSFSWYVITFALVALLSAYMQIVYFWIHAQPIPMNAGVSVYWQRILSPLMDARVVIVPLALPAIATLYAVGGLGKQPAKKETSPPPRVPVSVSVSRPKVDALPEPKQPAAQKVYDHLETHPEDVSLSIRKLAQRLQMPPATVYKAVRKYKAERGLDS